SPVADVTGVLRQQVADLHAVEDVGFVALVVELEAADDGLDAGLLADPVADQLASLLAVLRHHRGLEGSRGAGVPQGAVLAGQPPRGAPPRPLIAAPEDVGHVAEPTFEVAALEVSRLVLDQPRMPDVAAAK